MTTKHLKILTLTLVLLLLASTAIIAEPTIVGEAAVLMDAETGRVLWGKDETVQRAPASITKLITALVAIEKGNLQKEVKINEEAVNTSGSIVWLKVGETQTLENLLYAMMLNSGNDAAKAIAEHIGGSQEAFVKMMNEKAKEIGAISTNFINANGLSAEGHYSTAYDIALIMKEALENPDLRKIMGTQYKDWDGADWKSQLANLNQMLWQYEGTIGGKTGYVSEAGRCLVTAANRDGLELISVVLGSNADRIWSDSTKILDHGYNNFHKLKLTTKSDEILQVETAGTTIPVVTGKDVEYLTSKNAEHIPTSKIKMHQIKLPLKKGDIIGELEFVLNDEVIEKTDLLSAQDVKKPITLLDIYIKISLSILGIAGILIMLKGFIMFRKRSSFSSRRGRRFSRGSRYSRANRYKI